MTDFDASQQRVLALDPAAHARVLGAPGSGKTRTLVEAFARLADQAGWGVDELLVLAPNRLVASALRQRIEQRLDRAMAGTPARTAASFAFAVLQSRAAARGLQSPRLLTGTAHDETIAAVILELIEGRLQLEDSLPFASEVLLGDAFRAELRELNRVLDDFALQPGELRDALISPGGSADTTAPTEFANQWLGALALLEATQQRLAAERPGELASSAMMRAACAAIESEAELKLPRLVLIDDAGELGEGALALLAALARRGTRIWAFGDPDIATGAFQGERTGVLAGLTAELRRRGAASRRGEPEEQHVELDTVYRHPGEIRELVRRLAERVGTAGAGSQRRAAARDEAGASVQFAVVGTPSEQLGAIAHRLRSRHLGLGGGEPLRWSQMAVVCRSRAEAKRAARLLAGQQVPTGVAAGGLVLREHQLVRELIRLLQHALELAPLGAREVHELLGGAVGGLDQIALRRLRGALRLQENRAATAAGRAAVSVDELVLEAFEFPGDRPVIDTRGARRLMRLGRLAAAGSAAHRAGGTPREVLWQLWHGTGLADELQSQALDGRGARADEAHRALDAVVGLFFALQRHEEQDSERPISALLDELLMSTVPEDSLAARSEREAVTVTTPQSLIGREFELVCVLGLQDGVWPNLRSRGSMLGTTALERWLRGAEASTPSRRDTMHDELRLLVHSVARAGRELLMVAVSNEDQHPSVFFSIARGSGTLQSLPSSRLTLRGAVAEMRRRLAFNPSDDEALESLAALARAGVPGAHPDEWYGVMPPSTQAPLVDIEGDPQAAVQVSPSQIEAVETCPLNWLVSRIGGGDGDYRVDLGTLLHHALETAQAPASAEQILEIVRMEWGGLRFEAEWQSRRAELEAAEMAAALADYLADFGRAERQLLATEARFEVPIDFARLRGTADRLEAEPGPDGEQRIIVVDLKTGASTPSKAELEQHAQLQAYQLGVIKGSFLSPTGEPIVGAASGARLLYVHPKTVGKTRREKGESYTVIEQQGLGEAEQQGFERRVLEAATVMAAGRFIARVEHHCEDRFALGKSCALHVVPAVSHA